MTRDATTEQERLQWVASLLGAERSRFEAVGVRSELLPLRVDGEGSRRESEVEVYFWRGDRLVNAVAWPIYRAGRLVCSDDEWRDAVHGDLDEIASLSRSPE
jgi:hypothetical protein